MDIFKELLSIKTFKGINKKNIGPIDNTDGCVFITNHNNNPKYDCYLGLGTTTHLRVENDIYIRYDNIPIYCFDPNVDYFVPHKIDTLHFEKTYNKKTINHILESYQNILCKIDMKNLEWNFLRELDVGYFRNIDTIILKLHLYSIDLDILNKIKKYFEILHIRGYSKVEQIYIYLNEKEKVYIPSVVELTLVNKKNIDKQLFPNNNLIPSSCEDRNIFINMNYEPFFYLNDNIKNDNIYRLSVIHDKLNIKFGSKFDEYPEQLLAVTFIQSTDRVLELGGNIGRNSCVISSILEDSSHLVVIEPNKEYMEKLTINRDNNNFKFNILPCALSSVPLIQNGFNTIPYDINYPVPENWELVSTITYEDYDFKQFNVLVVDCEGALYYILCDYPQLLDNIKTIIIENDFTILEHGNWVHIFFMGRGFKNVYQESGEWGFFYNNFYEVWIKD